MILSPISIIPAAGFLIFWIFVWRRWDKKQPEPFHALAIATIFGMLAAYAMVYFGKSELYFSIKENFKEGLLLTVILAVAEELLKLLGFILGAFLYRRYINQLVDGLVYGAATALGFAFIENLLYFQNFEATTPLIIFRSLDGMFAHTLFTGIFAFYFAVAFSHMKIGQRKIPIAKPQNLNAITFIKDFFLALTFHITRRHILPHRPSQHGHRPTDIIFEGFLLAVFAHFLHNILATQQIAGRTLAFLMPVLIVFLAIFAFSLFKQPWYIRMVASGTKHAGVTQR